MISVGRGTFHYEVEGRPEGLLDLMEVRMMV